MKKKALILGTALAVLSFFAVKKHHQKSSQLWFTLEKIEVNEELNMISGTCIEGTYLGEMEVYLPDTMDISKFASGMKVRVLGGPAMTMSLPPHLTNCTKIEIIED